MPDKITRRSRLFTSSLSIPLWNRNRQISLGFWARVTKETHRKDATDIANSPEKYQYGCLPDGKYIRVLDLYAGQGGDPVAGRLRDVSLNDDKHEFQALSYVWGSREYLQRIELESKFLDTMPNLDKALRAIRSPTDTVTIWVDALCINQDDIAERSQQVQYMGEIYAKAQTVRVWLGDESETTSFGMETLSYLAGDRPFAGSPWNRSHPQDVSQAVQDILERPYFARIWVVQEAALGRRVRLQVGSQSMSWDSGQATRRFLARIKLAELSPSWEGPLQNIDLRPLSELLEQSLAHVNKLQGRVEPPSLLDIAHSMRHRQATDPRDKIYAMMGLVSPEEVAGFVPDYSLSWQDTYDRFYKLIERQVLQNPNRTLDNMREEGQAAA